MKNLVNLILSSSLVMFVSLTAHAQITKNTDGLVIRGKVLNVELKRKDKNYVDGELKLSLDFVNEGIEPIIILQPVGSEDEHRYIFWQADVALAKTKEDAEAGKYVFSLMALPSVSPFPIFRQLAERLDQPAPPSEATRILQPKETWTWQTVASFHIGNVSHRVGDNLSWDEIYGINSPLWVRVTYSIFPYNVENFKKKLGVNLQKRWKNYGRLWFDRESTHNVITSEPMMLNLHDIKVNDSVNGEPNNSMNFAAASCGVSNGCRVVRLRLTIRKRRNTPSAASCGECTR